MPSWREVVFEKGIEGHAAVPIQMNVLLDRTHPCAIELLEAPKVL
jgi:hypothetical protein